MPTIQVRDFPKELYDLLVSLAKKERRSLSKQFIMILEKEFQKPEMNRLKTEKTLNQLSKIKIDDSFDAIDAVIFIREDRAR